MPMRARSALCCVFNRTLGRAFRTVAIASPHTALQQERGAVFHRVSDSETLELPV